MAELDPEDVEEEVAVLDGVVLDWRSRCWWVLTLRWKRAPTHTLPPMHPPAETSTGSSLHPSGENSTPPVIVGSQETARVNDREADMVRFTDAGAQGNLSVSKGSCAAKLSRRPPPEMFVGDSGLATNADAAATTAQLSVQHAPFASVSQVVQVASHGLLAAMRSNRTTARRTQRWRTPRAAACRQSAWVHTG